MQHTLIKTPNYYYCAIIMILSSSSRVCYILKNLALINFFLFSISSSILSFIFWLRDKL